MAFLASGGAVATSARVAGRHATSQTEAVTNPTAAVAQLPITFEPNVGQVGSSAAFLARGHGLQAAVAPTAATFAVPTRTNFVDRSSSLTAASLDLVGADAKADVRPSDQLPGTVNYLHGNDQSRWKTGIPTYGRVTVGGAYPGIDVSYHGETGALEYDFVVQPHADPSAIRLAVTGADRTTLDRDGNLVSTVAGNPLIQHKPVAYQSVDGKRRPVAAAFALDGDQVGFRLGKYDPGKTLVIDPTIAYSTYFGGSGDEFGTAINVDASGNVYIAGSTTSSDFPTTAGAFQTAHAAFQDAFVTKLNAAGTAALWSTYLGGDGDESGPSNVAVNAAGNAYIAGWTNSDNFPVKNALYATHLGNQDLYIAELNPTGTGLVYSTYLGSTDGNEGDASIAIDADGNMYVASTTGGTDYPTTAGVIQSTHAAGQPVWIVSKLNPTGSALVFSTYLGGTGGDTANAIAVDGGGNVYVAGDTSSTDFPVLNAIQPTTDGSGDAAVAELNPTGTALVFSTFLGADGIESGKGVALDAARNVYVMGGVNIGAFPHTTPGAFQSTKPGGRDTWVVKLAAGGSPLVYGSYIGGSGTDVANGLGTLAVDAAGHAYVLGRTISNNFPITPNATKTVRTGANAFVTELSLNGSHALFSTFIGGTGTDTPEGIALDSSGNIYVVGETTGGFPTVNAVQGTYGGGTFDAYVAKITAPRRSAEDFDGNGTSDIAVFRPSTGYWFVNGGAATQYAASGDVPVPGDYDGDGKTDIAVYRPSTGDWFVLNGTQSTWGAPGDIPVPADYNGDGKTDIAVYRPSTGQWFVQGGTTAVWGVPGDVPVPGDYDGDGAADIAVYRPSTGQWFVLNGATTVWGAGGDVPVPADYDGDGRTDIAVYRPSTGQWFVLGGTTTVWGLSTDIPVPADYNGDGKADIAVYRPSTGQWFVLGSAPVVWGAAGDRPLELPEAIRLAYYP